METKTSNVHSRGERPLRRTAPLKLSLTSSTTFERNANNMFSSCCHKKARFNPILRYWECTFCGDETELVESVIDLTKPRV